MKFLAVFKTISGNHYKRAFSFFFMLDSRWFLISGAHFFFAVTTQDESPVGLDQSDEDDDDSSDYFADAETSSCGSCDDDPGLPEISEKKGRFVYIP